MFYHTQLLNANVITYSAAIKNEPTNIPSSNANRLFIYSPSYDVYN